MSVHTAAAWAAEASGFPYEPYLVSGADVAELAAAFAVTGAVTLGPPALAAPAYERLLAEARVQRDVAAWELKGRRDQPGEIAQDTMRAHLGPLCRELMAASATRALLQAVTGHVVVPGWSATCLTFYEQEGMYLAAHRDKEDACQYAILMYLDAAWPDGREPGPGLKLHVRGADDRGVALRVTARPNRMLILHGARLTHFRPPLADGEQLAMLNGCFAVVGNGDGT